MLGKIAMIIIIHTIYSSLRWRMFLQANNEQVMSLPSDILLQILLGAILASIAILNNTKKLKKINQFIKTTTYDKSFERKNFKAYDSQRAKILGQIVKEKLGIKDQQ